MGGALGCEDRMCMCVGLCMGDSESVVCVFVCYR